MFRSAVAAAEGNTRHALSRDLLEKRGNLWKERPEFQPLANSFPLAPGFDNKIDMMHASYVILDGLKSNDLASRLQATNLFVLLLSSEHSFPIPEVVQHFVIPRLVEFLATGDYPQLQIEAARALRIIASGTSEDTWLIVTVGAVPVFVELLGSASVDLLEQVLWALGNIARVSPVLCDLVLLSGALSPLLALLEKNAAKALLQEKAIILRKAAWALSNLFRGSFDLMSLALQALEKLIRSDDVEILENVCFTLALLCEDTHDGIEEIIDRNFCPILVDLLGHPSPRVHSPSLDTVRIIVARRADKVQAILSHVKALPNLKALLTKTCDESTKTWVCWTIANITLGEIKQMDVYVDDLIEAGLICALCDLLQSPYSAIWCITRLEAARAMSNITSRCTPEQIFCIVKQGCIKALCRALLESNVLSTVTECMVVLENILNAGKAKPGVVDGYTRKILEAGGLDILTKIHHGMFPPAGEEAQSKAIKILETHWPDVLSGFGSGFAKGGTAPKL